MSLFFHILNQRIVKKVKKIKVVLTDVDGVLTDGGMFYTKDGDAIKKFHARDGMGISLLRKNKIPTIIVTKESTLMVKAWAKKMHVAKLYDGIKQKEEIHLLSALESKGHVQFYGYFPLLVMEYL